MSVSRVPTANLAGLGESSRAAGRAAPAPWPDRRPGGHPEPDDRGHPDVAGVPAGDEAGRIDLALPAPAEPVELDAGHFLARRVERTRVQPDRLPDLDFGVGRDDLDLGDRLLLKYREEEEH